MDINTWQAWEHNSSPWVGYTSEEGAVYYYNKETGESSWENPIGVTPLHQPEHDTVEDYEYSSETNFQADGGVTETHLKTTQLRLRMRIPVRQRTLIASAKFGANFSRMRHFQQNRHLLTIERLYHQR